MGGVWQVTADRIQFSFYFANAAGVIIPAVAYRLKSMPINSLSLVNQKLAYARALLALVPAQEAHDDSTSALQRKALLDATVSHLICAYQLYLRELADNFQVKLSASIKTERDLVSALDELGKTPSESTELLQLRADEDSWLACLHRSHEQQWNLPIAAPQIGRSMEENLIGIIPIDAKSEAIEASLPHVTAWNKALVALIQRQRETSVEY